MKIEVTRSWSQGSISETTTASVDFVWKEEPTYDNITDMVVAIKQAIHEADQSPAPQVNVYVDGAKVPSEDGGIKQ